MDRRIGMLVALGAALGSVHDAEMFKPPRAKKVSRSSVWTEEELGRHRRAAEKAEEKRLRRQERNRRNQEKHQ